jgi:hypothetical protein
MQKRTVVCKGLDAVVESVDHTNDISVDFDSRRLGKESRMAPPRTPVVQQASIRSKHLNAVIVGVGHHDSSVGELGHAGWVSKLPRLDASASDSQEVLAIDGINLDAIISGVGDHNSIIEHIHVQWQAELAIAATVLANGSQPGPILVEPNDPMTIRFCDEDLIAVPVGVDSAWSAKLTEIQWLQPLWARKLNGAGIRLGQNESSIFKPRDATGAVKVSVRPGGRVDWRCRSQGTGAQQHVEWIHLGVHSTNVPEMGRWHYVLIRGTVSQRPERICVGSAPIQS